MTSTEKNSAHELIFNAAHHEYARGMKAYSLFKLHNRTNGEDLVQVAFTKTWIYLVKGGKIDLMKAFLYRVLNDLIIDEYRKHSTISLDALREKGFDSIQDHSKRLINFLDGKAAMLLILRLPEKYQKVIRMRYVQDLTLKEMSDATGISRNTLAVQTHRGLEKLRILYNKK